jgi:hypothetical protein
MTCSHCGALVVEDRFMDWTARWRCLGCGNVERVIEAESSLNHCQLDLADFELRYCDDEVHLGWESLVRTQITAPTTSPQSASEGSM